MVCETQRLISKKNQDAHLLKATVIVSEELAHGHRDSGIRPLLSNALRKASQADNDPET